MLMIGGRVWYLQVMQKGEYEKEALKPQRRVVIEKVERAPIVDRFGKPLAVNREQFNVAVRYGEIREVPRVRKVGREKSYPRREHVKKLSYFLSRELGKDAGEIEDLIYAKAALFPHTQFVVGEDVSEEQYYRLRAIEGDVPGLCMQRVVKRVYPQGRVASDLIGYVGTISQEQYVQIGMEMKALEEYLEERIAGRMPVLPKGFESPAEVKLRLEELKERAYGLNDLVGKMGVEAKFDRELRGYAGKRVMEVDVKGNILRELPGSRPAVGGEKVVLSISAELQEFAEKLLVEREEMGSVDDPWVKGGAIVAMIPQTGEVVALASTPRFDPNDFISVSDEGMQKKKNAAMGRWLESASYLGEVWDGKRYIERERFERKGNAIHEEGTLLDWDSFLRQVISPGSSLELAMQEVGSVGAAYQLLNAVEQLVEMSGADDVNALIEVIYSDHFASRKSVLEEVKDEIREKLLTDHERYFDLKERLDHAFFKLKHNNDKLLLLDLCRLLIEPGLFERDVIEQFGKMPLCNYRKIAQGFLLFENRLRDIAKKHFHTNEFAAWREKHFKKCLDEERKREKREGRYVRPFTDYLEKWEREQFAQYWEKERWNLISSVLYGDEESWKEQTLFKALAEGLDQVEPEVGLALLKTVRSYEQLDEPLYGKYRSIRNESGVQKGKHLAAAFYPLHGYGYMTAAGYRQHVAPGSVFKLAVAYAGLKDRWERGEKDLNPLTLIDEITREGVLGKPKGILGYFDNGEPIRRSYKGGILPRCHPNIGRIDMKKAIENSSNIYFSILANDYLERDALLNAVRELGFGERTGIEVSGEIRGGLPVDLSYNQTGLYSFAIGQHTTVVSPVQMTQMVGTIANQGQVIAPKLIRSIEGKKWSDHLDPFLSSSFPFKGSLEAVGIDFPLFTQAIPKEEEMQVSHLKPRMKSELCFPKEIQRTLLQGMHNVINGPKGTARPSNIIGDYRVKSDYKDLRQYLVGKTGTAEFYHRSGIDEESKPVIKNNAWFGMISYRSPKHAGSTDWDDAELVVVVYLPYGAAGKIAAPIASQIVKKWKNIVDCKSTI